MRYLETPNKKGDADRFMGFVCTKFISRIQGPLASEKIPARQSSPKIVFFGHNLNLVTPKLNCTDMPRAMRSDFSTVRATFVLPTHQFDRMNLFWYVVLTDIRIRVFCLLIYVAGITNE